MSFVDQTLTCRDCGTPFVWSVGEQEFFASKGYTNTPTRCQSCRAARRGAQGGGNGGSYASREPRQMFPAVCTACGADTMVPFQPQTTKPVYCSACFSKVREYR